ncbi:MAG: hypothetical protein WC655_27690 [Candidatus Hydrogenedentales bacterium]
MTRDQKIALSIIGVLAMLYVIGKSVDRPKPATPQVVAPVETPAPAQLDAIREPIPELEPGAWYQVSAVTLLLSTPSKDEAVQAAALKIPRGGHFKAVSKSDRFYYVNVNDGDLVHAGYLDGDHLAMQDVRPVVADIVPQLATPTVPTPVTMQTVYIAPRSGKKYHNATDCSGLRKAREVIAIDEASARRQGYTECGICWP